MDSGRVSCSTCSGGSSDEQGAECLSECVELRRERTDEHLAREGAERPKQDGPGPLGWLWVRGACAHVVRAMWAESSHGVSVSDVSRGQISRQSNWRKERETMEVYVDASCEERHGRDPYEGEAPRDFSGFEL